MILFCLLLGVFAIGAPGVPGGTVMASLGLITGVLGFDETGTALMLTIFALQDSFGTACNVTGDGALTLFLTGYAVESTGKNMPHKAYVVMENLKIGKHLVLPFFCAFRSNKILFLSGFLIHKQIKTAPKSADPIRRTCIVVRLVFVYVRRYFIS
jgi:hypothetical protein